MMVCSHLNLPVITHVRRHNLGKNWRNNYSRNVILVETTALSTATVTRPNGDQYFFNLDTTTQEWTGDPDVMGRLSTIEDGGGVQTGWQYINKNDETETFDIDGYLISLSNRSGVTHQLTYDVDVASGGDGNPETPDLITHSLTNHSLALLHDQRSRITKITLQPSGEEYLFEYEIFLDQLEVVIYPDDTIGDETDNPRMTYLYNEPEHLSGGATSPVALTGMLDENGDRHSTWKYDGNRATHHIRAPDNPGGPVSEVIITYNADGTRTIQDAFGGTRTYSFDIKHGVPLLSNVAGGSCLTCGTELQAATYDANGFVASRTDFEGNVTNFVNNTRGLQESRTEAVGTPEERTITTEWHPDFRLPTKITEPGKETEFSYDTQGRLLSRTEREI